MRPLTFSLIFLAGCSSAPDSYAPPIQRQPLTGVEPRAFTHFVNMNDANAEAYFVADIRPLEGSTWRWTGKKPTLQFYLDDTRKVRFTVDYTISNHTLKDTGPVTLTVTINGQPFHTIRHPKEGQFQIDKPVPAQLLKPQSINLVEIAVNPFWTSPADGNILGFILVRAGFVK